MICDACVFEEWVKEAHRLPVHERTLAKLNVTQVLFKRMTGHYKAVSYDFADDSSYENGKVYCACR